MKKLEDRIKDRLEGYESSLPEGDLAEFKALLDASSIAGTKRRPAYLAWLAPLAVAAGLALFFVLRHGPQPDVIQVVDGGSLMADVTEVFPEEVAEPSVPIRAVQSAAVEAVNEELCEEPYLELEAEDPAPDVSEQEVYDHGSPRTVMPEQKEEGYSPFVPSGGNRKPVSMKVGRATAGVVGGAGVAALAGALPQVLMKSDNNLQDGPFDGPGGILTDPEPPVDRRTWNDTHHMPLRTGLSLRIPFAERWSLTTGLDYSWYASGLEYSLSGIHKQNAHYLEIPLRADYTVARNRWMNVYVGAGGSVDFCVAAFDAGQKKAKDGLGFSLIGTGGIQFNISRNVGLFLDPTLSWDITSGSRVLETFRSEHPVMLSVSSGLRLTVPVKK